MEMKHFTWEDDVKPAFERAIALKGKDYVYRAVELNGDRHCVNWELDENGSKVPSCIVGHVLMDLMPDYEIYQYSGSDAVIWHIKRSGVAEFDFVSELVMSYTQSRQDSGIPWGRALAQAIEESSDYINNSKEN